MSRETTRRSRDETARLVREAAVRLLERDGLQGFANSVRLDDALALLLDDDGIRLTHGSIYGRIWADQRDFQLDVVATAVARYDGSDIGDAMTAVLSNPSPVDPAPDGSTGEGVAPTALALAFSSAADTATRSRMWNLWLGASAAVVSTPGTEDDERLAAALGSARAAVTDSVASALSGLVLAPDPQLGGRGAVDPAVLARFFVTLLIGASVTLDVAETSRVLVAAFPLT